MIHFSPLSSDIEKTLSYITNTKDPRAGAIISSDETIMTEIEDAETSATIAMTIYST